MCPRSRQKQRGNNGYQYDQDSDSEASETTTSDRSLNPTNHANRAASLEALRQREAWLRARVEEVEQEVQDEHIRLQQELVRAEEARRRLADVRAARRALIAKLRAQREADSNNKPPPGGSAT